MVMEGCLRVRELLSMSHTRQSTHTLPSHVLISMARTRSLSLRHRRTQVQQTVT
jgi:hypothetical protein